MKKSIVISLLTVTILFCTALCSFASTGIVTTDTLRLREEASTNASIVTLLSINDEVEILEEINGWYKIQSGEYVGYVSAEYIELITNSDEEVAEEETDTEEETVENIENGENTEEITNSENMTTVKVILAETEIYVTPLINSIVLETVKEEKEIEIISEVNDWAYIKIEDTKGWVKTESITEKEVENQESEENNNTSSQKTGYISGSSVNFREENNSTATVISTLSRNTKITVIEELEDGWSKIEYNGKTGYVASDYISDTEVATTSRSASSRKTSSSTSTTSSDTTTSSSTESSSGTTSTSGSATGAEIVAYAKQYLGYKYTYGGSSPSTGFDCSGFTTYVYKHFGYSLSRSSSAQSSNGTAVSKSNLQQGDIICFSRSSSSTSIGHVGIYIGNGQFIHAANSRKGVIISNVSGAGYYYVCARRIV